MECLTFVVGQTILYIAQYAMCGISKPDQWQAAQALYGVGTLAANVVNAFYAATFPSIVHNLPKVVESEQKVATGEKTYVSICQLDLDLNCTTLTYTV